MSANHTHAPLGDNLELFHTPSGEPYATLDVNGHRETWALGSKKFRQVLVHHFYKANGEMPSNKTVQNTLRALEGQAHFDGPELPVDFRVGGQDGAIYIDLCNDQWQSVIVTPNSWDVVSQSPVKFRRVSTMRALPIPERGGSIDELRRFVNVGSEDDWKLLASYLVRAFCSADPYPMLVLNGQQGAAKSTLTRVIRALIDPNEAPIRTFPGSERDLFIGASQSWVQAFDNLSQLPARQSDALCRLATGGSLVTRKLFTDGDEAVFNATRPVVLNGIEDLVIRGDLLDRSIVFQLPTLSRAQRQDERTFWQAFESARPRILGALLDAVSTALRNQDHVELPELPRMADFAIFSCATAPAFGWTPEDFMDAYEQNIRSASDIALESSPVAQAVLNLMEHYTVWEGTATQLLATLSSYFDGMPKRECPQTPQKLSNELRRLEPNLLKAGVTFTSYRKNGGTRERMITLSREPGDEPLPPNSASGPGDEPLSPESPSGPSSPNFSSGQHDGVPVTRLIEIFESTCQSYLEDEHLDLAA